MAVFVRSKRVTDPLNDRVKACLCGEDYRKNGHVSSSGSEREADDDSAFSNLIGGFFLEEYSENDSSSGPHTFESPEDSAVNGPCHDPTDLLRSVLDPSVNDRFRQKLSSYVSKAAERLASLKANRSSFRRALMTWLRDDGYNAGICKTKWESSGGLAGGSYEFIDVVGSSGRRYVVEVDLAAEFEIARPTEEYGRVQMVLPSVYVGPPEELKRIVRLVSDAARWSLKSRGLHLPPWRKNRYMQAKWLGPHRRSVGQIPTGINRFSVKCRSVGFDAGSGLLPVTTPTR